MRICGEKLKFSKGTYSGVKKVREHGADTIEANKENEEFIYSFKIQGVKRPTLKKISCQNDTIF